MSVKLHDTIQAAENAARSAARAVGQCPKGLALNALATMLYQARCVAFALDAGEEPAPGNLNVTLSDPPKSA